MRALYVAGEADPIAIVLGAGSLDEAMTGLDSLQRSARQSRAICAQARAARTEVRARARELAARERRLDSLAAAARGHATALAAAVDRRRAYVAELRRREGAARAAAAERQARAAQVVSQTIGATAASPTVRVVEAAGTETPAVRGVHTLTVDAVAYNLPGRTASGLPVGHGVVAVDPAVIPLGTRMIVPGYGTAIAADVGSAVRGLVIDLWFPTLAEAQAWGRRTVTITLL